MRTGQEYRDSSPVEPAEAPAPHPSSFGINLRRIRKDRCLSQAELARRSGVMPLSISNYENGATRNANGASLEALADALGVGVDDLLRPVPSDTRRDPVASPSACPSRFGQRLRTLRLERGLSQAAFARLSGISQVQLSQYETGRVPWAGGRNLSRLAAALGVAVDDLLRDESPTSMREPEDA